MSSTATAKARLNRQAGEPATGFASRSDIQTAFDDLRTEWMADDAAITLDDLAGVIASGATTGQALVYNGTYWSPATVGGGEGTGNGPEAIYLDDFAGADDDDKFTAARSYAAAQTYRPPIQLLPKSYSFSPFASYDGLRLIGAPGPSSQADRGSSPGSMATRVNCTGSGYWLTVTADEVAGAAYDISIQGIAFRGNSNLAWLGHASNQLNYSSISDVSFSDFRTVLGTQSNKLLILGCVFSGFWEINNSYDGAIHIGGSDNALWTDGLLLDSNTAYVASGQSHMKLSYLAKSTIGGSGIVYITCEGDWGGLLIEGNTTDGPVFISNLVAEGRNAGAPGTRACIRQTSGWTHLDNVWASFCQADPIQVTGGLMLLDRGAYRPCTSSPPDRWVNHTGGTLNIARCYQSGIAKPVVNSSGGTIVADSTLTVV